MPRHVRAGCLALLVVCAMAVAAPARAQELAVVLDGAATAELPPADKAFVTIPITLGPDVDASRLSTEVVRVRRGQLEIGDDEGTVTAEPVAGLPGVRLHVEGLARAATYEVLVTVAHAGARQHVTFTLVRPPARVSAPASVTVEQIVVVPEWRLGEANVEQPIVTVVADDSRLSDLTGRTAEAARGTITVTDSDGPHPPGQPVQVAYKLEGTFPLGTHTRTVELRARELAEPVTVAFTVTTRRHPGLLVALLVAGVFLGFVARTFAPAVTGATGARRRAAVLRGQLDALEADYEDATFRSELATPRERATRPGWRRSTINEQVTLAAKEAEEARRRVEARLTAADRRLRELALVCDPPWQLPPTLAGQLDESCTIRDEALARLDANDADEATKHLDAVNHAVAETLLPSAQQWLATLSGELGGLRRGLAGRTEGAQARLLNALDIVLAGLPVASVADGPAGEDAAGEVEAGAADGADGASGVDASAGTVVATVPVSAVTETLRQVHRAVLAGAGVRDAMMRVADEAAEAATALTEVPSAEGALPELTHRISALRQAAKARPDDPLAAARVQAPALSALVAALHDAIVAPMPERARDAITTLLDSGDVSGALAELRSKLSRTDATAASTRLGAAEQEISARADADKVAAPAGAPAEPAIVFPPSRPRATTRLRLAPQLAAGALVGGFARALQVMIVLALVVVAGYPLFAAEWTGTAADIAKVLTWAFAIDLTVEGALAVTARHRTTAEMDPA